MEFTIEVEPRFSQGLFFDSWAHDFKLTFHTSFGDIVSKIKDSDRIYNADPAYWPIRKVIIAWFLDMSKAFK